MQAQILLPDGFRFSSANGRHCQEIESREEERNHFGFATFASSGSKRSSRRYRVQGLCSGYTAPLVITGGRVCASSTTLMGSGFGSGSSMSAVSVAWNLRVLTLEEQKRSRRWWPPKILWCQCLLASRKAALLRQWQRSLQQLSDTNSHGLRAANSQNRQPKFGYLDLVDND